VIRHGPSRRVVHVRRVKRSVISDLGDSACLILAPAGMNKIVRSCCEIIPTIPSE